MAGLTSRECPACGVLVLRTHDCRASALIPTTVPPRKAAISRHPAGRKRAPQPCPDHPTEPINYCKLCRLEATRPPADWRPTQGLVE